MKIALYILAGVVAVGVAYAVTPDLIRYMKIRSM
jgi:hypothetical protein